jgi:hypothetical protein
VDLIYNNYLKSHGHGDSFRVDIGPATRPIKSYYEETLLTVENIYNSCNEKLYLLYSGGMDSEYVFSILLQLGIKFTPVIIKLNPNYNNHDLKYAFDFCESKGVTPQIIDINFDKFVESGLIVDIARSIKSSGYQIPATMYAASKLDGFILLGNDPPYMKLNQLTNTWQLEELELIHSILNYFKQYPVKGCPFLLSYTPEMMLSFLKDPTMVNLANHRYPGKLGTNTSKVHVYNNGSNFNLLNRPKYTGYENIETSSIFQHENLQIFKDFSKVWGGAYYENYHDVISRLTCS